jgi:Domain of unknown function (DUF4145)
LRSGRICWNVRQMKCPHCTVDFHDNEQLVNLQNDNEGHWAIGLRRCSACNRLVLRLINGNWNASNQRFNAITGSRLVNPKTSGRAPISADVPQKYAEDYKEACLVLADSAKASAALSRRCLQLLLRDEAKVKHQDLFTEIQELLDRRTLPSHIADSLDAVRVIGNFAAHPMKSQSTGEIVPVEPGEAEWNLDALESVFDFYFVAPARTKARKDALNKKLADAGKPPVK